MYLGDESLGSRGLQVIGFWILHYVKNYVISVKLVIYSDQCRGKNQNIKIITFLCNYIIASTSFTTEAIYHKFLLSGHSYLSYDQDFGLIGKQKEFYLDVHLPNGWKTLILSAKNKNFINC